EFPVSPLAVPDLTQLPSPEALTQQAAVQLFVLRTQAIQPAFHVTPANARAIAEICVHLDGLPLAIELAAARAKLLPPQALLKRLSQRLLVLTGGAQDLPARQQTLREFGVECLHRQGELEAARQEHARYYLALVEAAEPHLFGPEQLRWLDRLERELDNLRAILQASIDDGAEEREVALRLGAAVR